MNNIKQQGLNAAKWSFLKTIMNPLKSFIISLFLARLLSPEDFAVIGMAMVFAAIVDGFVDFGLGQALVQKQETTEEQNNTVFYVNLLMGLSLSICMFSLSGLIADYFRMPIVKPVTQVLSLTFIFRGLNCVQKAQMTKELDFKTPFIAEFSGSFISGIIGIIMALMGYGVWSLVASQLFGNTISLIIIWIKSSWRPQLTFRLNSIKELWQFGYKMSLSQLIEIGVNRLDTLIIGRVFSAATLGFYYRADSLNKLVVQNSYSPFSIVLFPMLSKVQDDIVSVKKHLIKLLHLTSIVIFGLLGLMFLCASDIISVLFSDKWLPSVPFFRIMAIFSFSLTFDLLYYAVLQSLGKATEILKVRLFSKTIYIVLLFIGLQFGIYGVVFGVYISHFILYIMMAVQIGKSVDCLLSEQTLISSLYAIISICLVLFLYLLPAFSSPILNLIAKGSGFVFIYLIINKVIRTEGYEVVREIIRNQFEKYLRKKIFISLL